MELKENNESLDSIINSISNNEIGISQIEKEFLDLWIQAGIPEIDKLGPFSMTLREFDKPTIETLEKLKSYIQQLKTKKEKTKK